MKYINKRKEKWYIIAEAVAENKEDEAQIKHWKRVAKAAETLPTFEELANKK